MNTLFLMGIDNNDKLELINFVLCYRPILIEVWFQKQAVQVTPMTKMLACLKYDAITLFSNQYFYKYFFEITLER